MHPNGGAVESVGSIREVGNYSVSKHMLAHHVLAAKIVSVCCAQHFLWRAYAPIGGDAETCYFRSRRWQSVCQQAHALPFCVLRTRRWQSACPQADTPALLCLPHMLSPRTTPFICPSKGGMGAPPPCLRVALDLCTPDWQSRKILQFRSRCHQSVFQKSHALPFCLMGVWGFAPCLRISP